MNLIDIAATPLQRVVARGRAAGRRAGRRRWPAAELVGLMPASRGRSGAGAALHLPELAADRVLEVAAGGRVRRADGSFAAHVATIELTGHDLTIDDVEAVALGRRRGRRSRPTALDQIAASRALIERVVAERLPTYGVNTGFGRFVDVHIDAGAGDRAAAEPAAQPRLRRRRRRFRTRSCGRRRCCARTRSPRAPPACGSSRCSSCSTCSRPACMPVVPSRGSLGASGDLAPLAHLAPRARRRGPGPRSATRRCAGADALARAGLEPLELGAKEGLALINGTQFMAAIGALVAVPGPPAGEARRPGRRPDDRGGARVADAVLRPSCRRCGPIPARSASAANLYRLLDDSADRRLAPLVRPGAGRLLAALLAAGARRRARRRDLRRAGDRDRAERRHRQPARAGRAGRGDLERQLPRRAGRDSRWTRSRSRSPSWDRSPSAASSGC